MTVLSDEVNWDSSMLNVISKGFHETIFEVLVVFVSAAALYSTSDICAIRNAIGNMLGKLVEVQLSSCQKIYEAYV